MSIPSAEVSSIESKEAERYRPERAIDAKLSEGVGISVETTELAEIQVGGTETAPAPEPVQPAEPPCMGFTVKLSSVLQGIIWSEILSPPLCRRRRR
jgi:hypothetical protein